MIPLAITAVKRLPPRIAIMIRKEATVRQSTKVAGGTKFVTPPTSMVFILMARPMTKE